MKKFLWISGVLVAAGLAGWYFLSNGDVATRETVQATIGSVKQIVSVTGTVEADPEIDLKFRIPGTLKTVHVDVGDQVQAGTILAELENTDEAIQLSQARANLKLAQANLNLKKVGASDEDIAVSKAALDSTQTALDAAEVDLENAKNSTAEDIRKNEISVKDAERVLEGKRQALEVAKNAQGNTLETYQKNLDNTVVNAKITAEQALITIKAALDDSDNILGIDNADLNDDFEDYLGVTNRQTKLTAEDSYKTARDRYKAMKVTFDALPESQTADEITATLTDILTVNILAQTALSNTFTMLEFSLPSGAFTSTVLDTKKGTIDTAKTSLNTNASNIESAKQNIADAKLSYNSQENNQTGSVDTAQTNYDTAQNNLSIAQATLEQSKLSQKSTIDAAQNTVLLKKAEYDKALASYNLKIAKARPVDLAGLIAQVDKALADVQLAQSNLDKTNITAPADGVVAKIFGDAGENVVTNDIFIKMISPKKRIIANVAEVDIAKIDRNDAVEVTLDAFSPDDIFIAKIDDIDPSETLVQGVVYYQIRAFFNEEPAGVKPGMTANLEILANEKKDVLVVPTRAIKYSDEGKYVEVPGPKKNGEVTLEKRFIKTGLEGDLFTEITEGLAQGDAIITYSSN